MKLKNKQIYPVVTLAIIAIVGGGLFYIGNNKEGQKENEAVSISTPSPESFENTLGVTSSELKVTAVSVKTVPPTDLTQECPYKFTFDAAISADGPGEVKYKWEKSDMSNEPEKSIIFTTAGTMNVSTDWILEGAGTKYTGWVQLKIISPNQLTSNQAQYSLLCN